MVIYFTLVIWTEGFNTLIAFSETEITGFVGGIVCALFLSVKRRYAWRYGRMNSTTLGAFYFPGSARFIVSCCWFEETACSTVKTCISMFRTF